MWKRDSQGQGLSSRPRFTRQNQPETKPAPLAYDSLPLSCGSADALQRTGGLCLSSYGGYRTARRPGRHVTYPAELVERDIAGNRGALGRKQTPHVPAGWLSNPSRGVLGQAVLDDLAVISLTRSLFAPRGPRQKSTVAYICDGTRSWGARFLCRPASRHARTTQLSLGWRLCSEKNRRFARARASARKVGLCHASQDRDAPCDQKATAGPERGHCGRGPAAPLD